MSAWQASNISKGQLNFQIDIDFATIAKGFGMKSVDFRYSPISGELLKDVLSSTGSCLINVPIDKNEGIYPIAPSGAPNKTMCLQVNDEYKREQIVKQLEN